MSAKATKILCLASLLAAVSAAPRRNESDLKWYCNAFCAGSGGVPVFDRETLKCSCLLGKESDGADVALVRKNANAVAMELEIVGEEGQADREVFKREISPAITSRKSPVVGQSTPIIQPHLSRQGAQRRLNIQQHLRNLPLIRRSSTTRNRVTHHPIRSAPQARHSPRAAAIRQRIRQRNLVGSAQDSEKSGDSPDVANRNGKEEKAPNGDQQQIITQPKETM